MLTKTPGSQGLENLDQETLVKSAYNTPATAADDRIAVLESRVAALEANAQLSRGRPDEVPRRDHIETVRSEGRYAKS